MGGGSPLNIYALGSAGPFLRGGLIHETSEALEIDVFLVFLFVYMYCIARLASIPGRVVSTSLLGQLRSIKKNRPGTEAS